MIASAVMLAATLLGQAAPPPPAAPAPASTTPPAPVPTLSEVDALRVENHRLKIQAAQLEIRLRELTLTEERRAVEAAVAAAHPGFAIDWNSGALVKRADTGDGVGK